MRGGEREGSNPYLLMARFQEPFVRERRQLALYPGNNYPATTSILVLKLGKSQHRISHSYSTPAFLQV